MSFAFLNPKSISLSCSAYLTWVLTKIETKMIQEQLKTNTSKSPAVVSRLEVRLALTDKPFLLEFEKFIDSELNRVIARLSTKLGHRMPSISHNLVRSGRNFAIIMSLTDGHSVASYEIELDQEERLFVLNSRDQKFILPTARTLGEILEFLLFNVFVNSK